MPNREIAMLGNPILTVPARKVEETELDVSELEIIKQDLLDKMIEKDVPGIAATQIGVDLCIIAFGFSKRERFPDTESGPLTVLVNPKFEPVTDEKIMPLNLTVSSCFYKRLERV